MKAGLFVAALVQLAVAQPHQNNHAHLHEERDVVTQVQTVTAVAQNAVVYVNGDGTPIATSYRQEAPAQATPEVVTSSVDQAPPAAPTTEFMAEHKKHHHHHHNKHHHHGKHHHHEKKHHHHHEKKHHHRAGLHNLNHGTGIVYSPYNADNSCKSPGQVSADLNKLHGYSWVRLYGVDCDQIQNVAPVAKSKGMHLFLGVYDLSNVAGDLQAMHTALNGDWSHVDAVSIGNELVNSGAASASQVCGAVDSAKGQLRGMNYRGPVVTVDTFNAIEQNPELCQVSDFVAANAHAFFDPNTPAPQAGSWARSTVRALKNVCHKDVIITESGWPHAGGSNGAAVAGVQQQHEAIHSLRHHFHKGGITLFTAFDDMWKTNNAYTFGAEQFWGIHRGQ